MAERRPSGQFTRQRSARIKRRQIRERGYLWCGICGQAIDGSLRFPNPMSWSVDHIVPVAAGGADDDDNCQGSHLRCNQAKGDGSIPGTPTEPPRQPCRPDPNSKPTEIAGGHTKHKCLEHGGWLQRNAAGDPAGDPTRCASVPW